MTIYDDREVRYGRTLIEVGGESWVCESWQELSGGWSVIEIQAEQQDFVGMDFRSDATGSEFLYRIEAASTVYGPPYNYPKRTLLIRRMP